MLLVAVEFSRAFNLFKREGRMDRELYESEVKKKHSNSVFLLFLASRLAYSFEITIIN